MDPLAGSPWSAPDMVAGFAQSSPNPVLMRFASDELMRGGATIAIDIGCGAGRNAVPLARMGWRVLGIDLSMPMLEAAALRARDEGLGHSVTLALAPMEALPVPEAVFDLVVAHGIWNLAPSAAVFRRAVREAARVARPGAGLFVFTFSRNTIPPEVDPVPGEPFVFTQFSGAPQCFLTEQQLIDELDAAGFTLDPGVPVTEYNRPRAGAVRLRPSGAPAKETGGSPPVIYEAAFRRAS
jgi:SAM-dependent methyltransferase